MSSPTELSNSKLLTQQEQQLRPQMLNLASSTETLVDRILGVVAAITFQLYSNLHLNKYLIRSAAQFLGWFAIFSFLSFFGCISIPPFPRVGLFQFSCWLEQLADRPCLTFFCLWSQQAVEVGG